MVKPHWENRQDQDDVDQLLLNAQLRDELEPYVDESVDLVNVRNKPTSFENEYLASMLAWERAPVLPISHWFDPPLMLPAPETLTWREIHETLWGTIRALHEKQIVLEYTAHLSDFQLYCLILRDILPSREKKLDMSPTYLHWHCLDLTDDPEIWLRYYATEGERKRWAEETGGSLPPSEESPFCRKMPRPAP
jgi:hypothetical protein